MLCAREERLPDGFAGRCRDPDAAPMATSFGCGRFGAGSGGFPGFRAESALGPDAGSGSAADEIPAGCVADLQPGADKAQERVAAVPPPVPPEGELGKAAVEMLLPEPVAYAHRPSLQVREGAVDPRHDLVGGPVPDRHRAAAGNARAAEPVVRPERRARLHGRLREPAQRIPREVPDPPEPQPPRRSLRAQLHPAPAISSFPSALRPGLLGGPALRRWGTIVSSASTNPRSRAPSEEAMARRSFCSISQDVVSLPSPGCCLSCAAEIPFECVAARWMAAIHFFSGTCVRCRNVPAVAEARFRQSRHWRAQRARLSRTAFRLPHSGHWNRPRQRIFARYSAHVSSSGNRSSSSARVIVGIGLLQTAMPQGLAESGRPVNPRTQHLVAATHLRI